MGGGGETRRNASSGKTAQRGRKGGRLSQRQTQRDTGRNESSGKREGRGEKKVRIARQRAGPGYICKELYKYTVL